MFKYFSVASILLSLMFAGNGVCERQFTQILGNRNYWENQNWTTNQTDALWSDGNWQDYKGKQDFEGRVVKKTQEIIIEGIKFEASIRLLKDDVQHPRELLLRSLEFQKEDCSRILDWAIRQYGLPRATYNLSGESETVEIIHKDAQWDLVNSRITFRSLAFYFPPTKTFMPTAIGLSFTHKDISEKLKDLIAIKCSQHGILTDARDTHGTIMKDIIFVIDENKRQILTINKSPMKGKQTITENEISVKYEDDITLIEYSINRVTGALKGKLRRLKEGSVGVDITGSCEKTNLDRKF